MGWLRHEAVADAAHRGRVWRDGAYWRLVCNDCDFGAGTIADGDVAIPWLMDTAAQHAQRATR